MVRKAVYHRIICVYLLCPFIEGRKNKTPEQIPAAPALLSASVYFIAILWKTTLLLLQGVVLLGSADTMARQELHDAIAKDERDDREHDEHRKDRYALP